MLEKSRTAQVILGFLTWGPKSGYDVKKAVGASIGGFWSESFGQIYPALAALAGGGLAVRTDGPRTGRRRQHTYSITDAGRDELRRWLAEPVAMPPPRNELLLKLFFGRPAGRDASIAHVRAFAGEQRALADRYAAIRERLRRLLATLEIIPITYAQFPDFPAVTDHFVVFARNAGYRSVTTQIVDDVW